MERQQDEWHWRPEPGWLWLSLLGMVAGALVGAVLAVVIVVVDVLGDGALNSDPGGPVMALLGLAVFGAVIGAAGGAVLGCAVGVVLMFLVGRGMPGRVPAVLAFVGAAATVGVLARPVLAPVLRAESGAVDVLISVSAVIAGLVAVSFRGQLPGRASDGRTARVRR